MLLTSIRKLRLKVTDPIDGVKRGNEWHVFDLSKLKNAYEIYNLYADEKICGQISCDGIGACLQDDKDLMYQFRIIKIH